MDAEKKHKVTKISGDEAREVDDLVAVESRLEISVNGKKVLSLYCTPIMVRELVVGLLMTEGIAEGICTDRMSIVYGRDIEVDVPAEGEVRAEGGAITSGCVGGITFKKKLSTGAMGDGLRIHAESLREVFREFQRKSGLYDRTGCIHSAAISDGKSLLCFAEDIGRHNAVDKAIGCCLLEPIDFKGKIMLASGRLSSEILGKCARWGIPVVVSRTAPTALALEIGDESGITVVGFLRGQRLNVYTHAERIIAGG